MTALAMWLTPSLLSFLDSVFFFFLHLFVCLSSDGWLFKAALEFFHVSL